MSGFQSILSKKKLLEQLGSSSNYYCFIFLICGWTACMAKCMKRWKAFYRDALGRKSLHLHLLASMWKESKDKGRSHYYLFYWSKVLGDSLGCLLCLLCGCVLFRAKLRRTVSLKRLLCIELSLSRPGGEVLVLMNSIRFCLQSRLT